MDEFGVRAGKLCYKQGIYIYRVLGIKGLSGLEIGVFGDFGMGGSRGLGDWRILGFAIEDWRLKN